ncbi:hypothetical protein SAMN04488009_1737 [Maribacter sedimenticola]|uniref:Uncharacterized protein n=1 Tax=Maribacter sedimenticola TaxID=228956 RepID=A0ABY1SG19_9FLAO|nr:hypothetical protein [Maribacter sedimenticola]SNR43987.1 hypothetical protein SAMN04488009_1737 [Maribacter sedimenticola]
MIDIVNHQVPLVMAIGIICLVLITALIGTCLFLRWKKVQPKGDILITPKKANVNIVTYNQAKRWLENSKKSLHQINTLSPDEINILKEELRKRQEVFNAFKNEIEIAHTLNVQLQGTYHILGFNQNKENSRYSGFLHLSRTGEHRVHAEWIIDGDQTQSGTGFYHNHILVINFSYEGEAQKIYKGVVIYTVVNESILNGFWSEKHANEAYLGIEEGRKLKDSETLFKTVHLN